ncbi:MAG: 30S ribosomal protein S11 [Candidatus Moranbacteria bacterium]|nr:30S ribosomal protein S11 [Candidatus Moranbacteria bacterium]
MGNKSIKKDKAKNVKQFKKLRRKRISRGQVHIKCSYNNTIVSLADLSGAILGWSSAGALGFKGAKKATPYAATMVSNRALENVARVGLKEVDVFVKGVGAGREAAIRALGNNGIKVNSIKDVTPIPHNGCRPRKARRV